VAKARKRLGRILLPASDDTIKAVRKKLPKFKPNDLRSVLGAAKKHGDLDLETAFQREFRRRNNDQVVQLLRSLQIDPSDPNARSRGFYILASLHHGVGYLAWYPLHTNRNAATWKPEHDLNLLREVTISQGRGLSRRQAIKALAQDRKKWSLFPYRPKGHFSTGSEREKREAALRARLRKLLASTRGRNSKICGFNSRQKIDTAQVRPLSIQLSH